MNYSVLINKQKHINKKIYLFCSFLLISTLLHPSFVKAQQHSATPAIAADSSKFLKKQPVKPKTHSSLFSNRKDSTYLHSPKRAALYSLALPGLGQIYNHKYWKLPIVYGGFGVMAYFIKTNTSDYRKFRDAYEYASSSINANDSPAPPNVYPPIPTPPNDLVKKYDANQLLEGREYYRRNVELSYIITVGWYLFVMIDAVVDAHFYNYNISDDISMQVKPWTPSLMPSPYPFRPSAGISLTFHIK